MNQFILVLAMMLLFFFATFSGFSSVYYGEKKWLILSVHIPINVLIISIVCIETAHTAELIAFFIVLFRLLNLLIILSMLLFVLEKKEIRKSLRLLSYTVMLLHAVIAILSFKFHYTPLYLTIIPTILLRIIFRPAKLDILIDREASEILQNLKEAIVIISADKEILSINHTMKKLLNVDGSNVLTFNDVSSGFSADRNTIDNWFNKTNTENICFVNKKYYLIHTVYLSGKGMIITASDIHENIVIQKNLEKSISDLENLTQTLQLYSQSNELLAIREERAMVYLHIQEIITEGLNKLKADLIKIKEEPPNNFDRILHKSRSLLNEVRAIVSNWRSITGADY